MKYNLTKLFKEELEKYKKGLHQARVGDKVWIGIEGTRVKWYDEVTKVSNDGKVVVKGGDLFNSDGRIFRGKSHKFQKQNNPNKTISAKIITQSEFDERYKSTKIDFLKKFDYNKLNIEDIESIIDAIPNHSQGNKLNKSRFK